MQEEGEKMDDFMSRIKLQAFKCEFGDTFEERVIEQIIAGIRDPDLQKVLLGKDKTLTLKQAFI